MTLDSLLLQAAEERFGHSIVPAVAAPTHAGHQVVVLTPAVEVITAELAALVGSVAIVGYGRKELLGWAADQAARL